MRITRHIAIIMSMCMIFAVTPVFTNAQTHSNKKHTVQILMGDVTLDEKITTGDATFLLKYCTEPGPEFFNEEQFDHADANIDGEINTCDATFVLRICAGLEDALYTEKEVLDYYMVGYGWGNLPKELPEGVVLFTTEPGAWLEGETVTVENAPGFVNEDGDGVEVPEGFVFTGWLADFDGQIYQPGDTYVMPAQDIGFEAQWEAYEETERHMVSYSYGTLPKEAPEGLTIVVEVPGEYLEGETVEVAFAPYFENEAGEAVAMPEGFVFTGYKASFNGNIYQPGDTFVMPGQEVLFEAQWEAYEETERHMVSYSYGTLPKEAPEGLTIVVEVPGEYLEGETVEVAFAPYFENEAGETVAMPEGFVFTGYKASFNGNTYQPGDTFVMPGQEVLLEAQWKAYEAPEEGKVVATLYDSFNEIAVQGTIIIPVTGSAVISNETLESPEGFIYSGNFSYNVTVENGITTPSSIRINVIPVKYEANTEYWLVKTIKGFNKINNRMDGNYMLNNDINLNSTNRYPFGWDWNNTYVEDVPFTGIFDGQGHSITELYIEHTNYYISNEEYTCFMNVGLFSVNAGTIRNLSVYTRLYDGYSLEYGVFGDINVGVIAGSNKGGIENCHVYGNVGSLDYHDTDRGGAGGITGSNTGVVSKCSMEGGAEGYYWIGGLVGKNFGTVKESYFVGSINTMADEETVYSYAIRYIGGICGGSNGTSTIENSYAVLSDLVVGDQVVGGICGWVKDAKVTNCYVANVNNIAYITGYAAADFGYVVSSPITSGIYASADTTINGGTLPKEYSASIWDMKGACLAKAPDLVNNRRGETLYTD